MRDEGSSYSTIILFSMKAIIRDTRWGDGGVCAALDKIDKLDKTNKL